MEQEIVQQKLSKRHRKGRVIFILFILIILVLGYGYYWYSGVVDRDMKAQTVLSENIGLKNSMEQFNKAKKAVSKEYERCQEFISQKQGDFGSFEYCKKFIEWSNTEALF